VPERDTNLAHAVNLAESGQTQQATDYFRKAISDNPNCGGAHYGLALTQKFDTHNNDVGQMEKVLQFPNLADRDRILVSLALGKVLDDLGRYDEAFEFIDAANLLQKKSLSYSHTGQKRFFDRHKQALDRRFVEHCAAATIADTTPILVLGMPRSGTSLVEQILASHPDVYGAGEVDHSRVFVERIRKLSGKQFPQDIDVIAPDRLKESAVAYIEQLKSDAGPFSRVTDKLPHNFLRIGFFVALMPGVRIVLCDRNALDNCFSIYMHYFSGDHGYACDLSNLGMYYKLYDELMAFWEEQFPGCIYRLHYGDLVEDTELQVRELLKYCDLSFSRDCLTFHRTRRSISSPSASQVRQPIYRDALGRADNYVNHLQALVEGLSG
jgi:tetratricopeptide (TPR) repeat protein